MKFEEKKKMALNFLESYLAAYKKYVDFFTENINVFTVSKKEKDFRNELINIKLKNEREYQDLLNESYNKYMADSSNYEKSRQKARSIKSIQNHIINNKKFCKDLEKIENYGIAKSYNFRGWTLHHRLEILLKLSVDELKEKNLYFDRPAEEFIYLSNRNHGILHKYGNVAGEDFTSNLKKENYI